MRERKGFLSHAASTNDSGPIVLAIHLENMNMAPEPARGAPTSGDAVDEMLALL